MVPRVLVYPSRVVEIGKTLRASLIFGKFDIRIDCLSALRTDAVAELGIRMVADIGFDLFPVALVVAYLLAG